MDTSVIVLHIFTFLKKFWILGFVTVESSAVFTGVYVNWTARNSGEKLAGWLQKGPANFYIHE